jgi:hypothetical protein
MAGVGERAAGMRNGGRQLREAENECRIHRGDKQSRGGEAEGACAGPAVAPSEIFAGDDKTDRDRPQLQRRQTLLQFMVSHDADVMPVFLLGADVKPMFLFHATTPCCFLLSLVVLRLPMSLKVQPRRQRGWFRNASIDRSRGSNHAS